MSISRLLVALLLFGGVAATATPDFCGTLSGRYDVLFNGVDHPHRRLALDFSGDGTTFRYELQVGETMRGQVGRPCAAGASAEDCARRLAALDDYFSFVEDNALSSQSEGRLALRCARARLQRFARTLVPPN